MTQLTFDVSRALARTWGPGDEVVVTTLDHDANVRPWVLAAESAGATVRTLDFDPATTELDDVTAVLSDRTRLVALTGASNLLGTRPPVAAVAEAAHRVGALVFVDGVHLAAHEPVDVTALGADLFAFSPYKLMGPHCGVLTAPTALLTALEPAKLEASTDRAPERWELGTLPYELMAGVSAMVEVVAGLAPGDATDRRGRVLASMAAVSAHEAGLLDTLEEGLAALAPRGVQVRSRAASRTPTLLLTLDGARVGPAEVHRGLAERGVNAPAGSFYAIHASRRLGLGDAGGVRVGLAPYTSPDDVRRLLEGLDALL